MGTCSQGVKCHDQTLRAHTRVKRHLCLTLLHASNVSWCRVLVFAVVHILFKTCASKHLVTPVYVYVDGCGADARAPRSPSPLVWSDVKEEAWDDDDDHHNNDVCTHVRVHNDHLRHDDDDELRDPLRDPLPQSAVLEHSSQPEAEDTLLKSYTYHHAHTHRFDTQPPVPPHQHSTGEGGGGGASGSGRGGLGAAAKTHRKNWSKSHSRAEATPNEATPDEATPGDASQASVGAALPHTWHTQTLHLQSQHGSGSLGGSGHGHSALGDSIQSNSSSSRLSSWALTALQEGRNKYRLVSQIPDRSTTPHHVYACTDDHRVTLLDIDIGTCL